MGKKISKVNLNNAPLAWGKDGLEYRSVMARLTARQVSLLKDLRVLCLGLVILLVGTMVTIIIMGR